MAVFDQKRPRFFTSQYCNSDIMDKNLHRIAKEIVQPAPMLFTIVHILR